MNKAEQETINNLVNLMRSIKSENDRFREDIKTQVDAINAKTDKKHLPFVMEQDILTTAQNAIGKAIEAAMVGYGSPMTKLVQEVVDEHSMQLRNIISSAFGEVINTANFKQSIIEAFSHKIARTIISNQNGLYDKVSNDLKQDAVFKAKVSLAVSNVVEECLSLRGMDAEQVNN
jgi:hypothetical protein